MRKRWSIRMRASRYAEEPRWPVTQGKEVHISGAEGIFTFSDIPAVVRRYLERAFNHSKGRADKVVITAEVLAERPKIIPALPVSTVVSRTPSEGTAIARSVLFSLGISRKAVRTGFAVIRTGGMRGAAIVGGKDGIRLEPDRQRGVRVSRLGITSSALRDLSERLSRNGIDTLTVREALILASKIISHDDVIAEFCVSDDPHYTTGYVASKKFGYLRIPHIKRKGSLVGGRALFVSEAANVDALIHYLERTPVMIGKARLCKGLQSAHEILTASHC